MKKNIVVLTALLWCIVARAEITPVVEIPAEFDKSKYSLRIIEETSRIHYIKQISDCNDTHYKDFFFVTLKLDIDRTPRHEPEKVPFSEWFCLFSVDVYKFGYDTGVYPEKVSFNKKQNRGWW
ncbi:hypothetical protein OH773_11105 [Buttiauxella sp. WJP83]|uniref:hypothetical protein n=1 Tax=Buttiauxella sp. WJP83 TaxID=2986951 RepID=UPI0022DE8786|nr:hypothetical protein [Buttiauxella sp. WJP83]WBM68764.1 hypothetical protein OH773_11105 [Buttiauxella sp. WJP83]